MIGKEYIGLAGKTFTKYTLAFLKFPSKYFIPVYSKCGHALASFCLLSADGACS